MLVDNSSDAHRINNSGQVVGYFSKSGGPVKYAHAFRTAPNQPINPTTDDLGTLGGETSVAYDINSAGWVVGQSNNAASPKYPPRAFLTAPNSSINSVTDSIGALPGHDLSQAYGINDLGQVVGYSAPGSGTPAARAFLYSKGVMSDLNDLIPPDSGWHLSVAKKINNRGQIVGHGYKYIVLSGYSEYRSFLLTPIPKSPFEDVNDRFAISVRILFGIIGGGGGVIIGPGGGPVPIPPPEPFLKSLSPEMRDILVGLALHELSFLVNNPRARKDIQRAALNLANKEIQHLIKSLARG
jgi:probable HAF family extracellular repeat protein